MYYNVGMLRGLLLHPLAINAEKLAVAKEARTHLESVIRLLETD